MKEENMAGKKKGPTVRPKKDKSWVIVGDAGPIVTDLVEQHHGQLKDCSVIVMGKPTAGTKNGRVELARPMIASEMTRALALHYGGEVVDYQIIVGMDLWPQMPGALRKRVLDRALCHFAGKDDETGKLSMRYPDVSGEFVEIIQRYGVPENDPDLQRFVKTAAKQMHFDFPKETAA